MASIQKRSSGKYLVRWRNAENKERSKQFDFMRDAKRFKAEIETELARGTYVDPRAGLVTLRDYFDEWKTRQLWVSGTRRTMDFTINSVPFANVSLNKIRKSHVESWIKAMEQTYATNTVHARLQSIRSVFRAAIGDGLLTRDPTFGVRLPRRENRNASIKIPTAAEVKAVMNAADDGFESFIALCAFAGLRRGEAAGLKLTDINFLGKSISISRQVQKEAYLDLEIRAPKYASDRIIYVPDELLVMLSEHIKKTGTYTEEQWLFFGGDGLPISPRQASYRWERAIARTTTAGVTLHTLRHFYASGLIADGCDVVTVQRAMGHKSPSVTLDTYSHMWPDAADRTRAASSGLIKSVFAANEDHMRTEITTGQV